MAIVIFSQYLGGATFLIVAQSSSATPCANRFCRTYPASRQPQTHHRRWCQVDPQASLGQGARWRALGLQREHRQRDVFRRWHQLRRVLFRMGPGVEGYQSREAERRQVGD